MRFLLIPSATVIAQEMQNIGKIPPVLYPVNDYPVLYYLLDIYSKMVDIVVNENKGDIHNYIKNNNLNNIKIIEL